MKCVCVCVCVVYSHYTHTHTSYYLILYSAENYMLQLNI